MNYSIEKEYDNFFQNKDDEMLNFPKEDLNPSMKFFNTKEFNFSDILLGNKRKKKNNKKHDKFSPDNLKRECKHLVIESALKFINDKIYKVYDKNIGYGLSIKRLFKLNQSQKINADVEFNKKFIKKTLKEILSDNITGQIKNYSKDHNKGVINAIIDEKKEEFEKIFNLTFIECEKHFIELEHIELLNGLTLFKELKGKIVNNTKKDGEAYYENLRTFLTSYEEIINRAKPRRKRRKKNLTIDE